MKLSTDRILTTHVGSLPRPQDVVDLIFAQDRGEPVDAARFETVVQRAVEDVIRLQKEAGVDIPSDGEQSKISYATYIRHRLTGLRAIRSGPRPGSGRFSGLSRQAGEGRHSATYKRRCARARSK
jgi:Methionine synthase II (cobalamin-independent)